jgi:hypothetical protein
MLSIGLRMGEDGTEPEEIGFVFDFKYLGHWFQSDGDGMRNIENIPAVRQPLVYQKLFVRWTQSTLNLRLLDREPAVRVSVVSTLAPMRSTMAVIVRFAGGQPILWNRVIFRR